MLTDPMRPLWIIPCLLLLIACGDRGAKDAGQSAYDSALREVRNLTFDQISDEFDCSLGCQAEEAGFEHAKANEIFDADDCPDVGTPFHNGCRAFADVFDDRLFAREAEEFRARAADARH
jgi:hypothetical protein